MSSGFNMDFVEHTEGFTVKTICGCRITYGPIPLSEFGMLTHGAGQSGSIMGRS